MEFIEITEIFIKLIVGLSILKVWLINRDKATPWRGGNASSMQEEFAAYGLSKNAMIIVGTLKCLFAVLLLTSIYFKSVEFTGAIGIAFLMLGAITMHVKISDPIKKSIPAAIFLLLSIAIIFI
ncbi:DoxX family protein [uncultured Nonlabens sp.]|uniref:DoxX family protein n=1 Tax=uncultured Nonlabens sp. TaxID=859306 RepID=UPI0026031A49|nr:DoxX family protein [uncultured Nonlabens sp.]